MNVAPTHAKPQALPSADTSRHAGEHRKEGESFGEVLAAALKLPAGHAFSWASEPAAAADYRSAPGGIPAAIGEDAVRFDARPIVGPSFVPPASIRAASSEPVELPAVAPADVNVSLFEPSLHRAMILVAPRVEAIVSGPVAWAITAPGPSLRTAASANVVAQSAEPIPPARTNRGISLASSSAPAQAPEPAKSELRTSISLTLLADEILVTVRGLDLTAAEEEALGEEVRSLLASSDFGGRALRVVTSRRA